MDRSTKVCPNCLVEYPRAEFHHKGGTGSRRSTCRECCAKYSRSYRRRRREERLGKFVAGVNRSRRTRATFRLVEATVKCFGSPEALATEWHQAIEQVRQRKPGSAELTRNYRAIFALGTAIYEATRRHPETAVSQPSLRQMSDAELEQALDDAIARIVGQCQGDAELEDDLTPAAPEGESDEDADPP